jgi:uncharacterized protein YuzE
MKITYDPEVDVLRILFSNAPMEESDEDKSGIIIDYDKDGNIVGMEILDASKRMLNPRAVDYAVMGWTLSGSQAQLGNRTRCKGSLCIAKPSLADNGVPK